MKLLRIITVSCLFIQGISFAGKPSVPEGPMPVMDATSIARLEDEIKEMGKQLEQQTHSAERLKNEIAQLADFKNPQAINDLLKESNSLIKQSQDINYELNKTDFSKSYQGYKTLEELQGGSGTTYDSFYKDNVNMTLSTINNANKAIEDTNQITNDDVNSAVSSAQGHIMSAQGTTQAVSGLAEINIQILNQLQAMHTQLAAMAVAQNAADAKKIQEEATGKADFSEIVSKDAKETILNYGDNPLPDPGF